MEILTALVLAVIIAFTWNVGVSAANKIGKRGNHSVMVKPNNLFGTDSKSDMGKEWSKKDVSKDT